MSDGGRMWMAVPVLGVVLAAALYMVAGGTSTGHAPVPVPSAATKTDKSGNTPRSGVPSAGADPAAPGPAVAQAGALSPEERHRRAQALLRGERQGLPGGAAPQGVLEGDRVALADHVDRRADEVLGQLEAAVEAARLKGKWDDRTNAHVDGVLDRLDADLAAIQKQVAAGTMDVATALGKMEQLGRDAATEIAKATDVPADDLTKQAGISPPATPQEEADAVWWDGIPFEEWAAQMEADPNNQKK